MKKFGQGLFVGVLITLLLVSTIALAVDNPIKLIINGQEIIPDVTPQLINGRVLVPARFVAEALGAKVDWDQENRAVVITSVKDAAKDPDTVDGEWMTIREIVETYNIAAGPTLNGGFSIDGKIAIVFYPPKEEGTHTLETNLGEVTLRIQEYVYYFKPAELKSFGVID